jgi:hypothetical protein
MKPYRVIPNLCLLLSFSGGVAHATTILYDLEGIVNSVTQSPSDPGVGAKKGDKAKAFLTVTLEDAIIGSVTPLGTEYLPVESSSMHFGSIDFTYGAQKMIVVGNNKGGKDYVYYINPGNPFSYAGPTQSGLADLVLKFEGPDDIIQDESLSNAGFLEKFNQRTFASTNKGQADCEPGDICFDLEGEFLTVTKQEVPVPEPATAGLLGMGLALALLYRRRPETPFN